VSTVGPLPTDPVALAKSWQDLFGPFHARTSREGSWSHPDGYGVDLVLK
jgi:hypothetical protein